MKLNESAVAKLVENNNGGKVEEVYGPAPIGSSAAWEVWAYVSEKGQFYTRFVIEKSGSDPLYFSDFQQVCTQLNDDINEYHIRKWTFYVAAFSFVVVLLAMLYITLTRADAQIITAILGVLASGAAFFFGRRVEAQK
ncbi:hypothetical protein [Xanthobacter sp. YC-JY1]|uniref:hypothetical protein n=1 Tax=Xanthobacter sp. YC-JY1 TaxID=2419844 RepID=UPI001F312391|nr:hypothetical protein [Xanthobacter sp. YC-JY1]